LKIPHVKKYSRQSWPNEGERAAIEFWNITVSLAAIRKQLKSLGMIPAQEKQNHGPYADTSIPSS